jgi:hypothetical protein
MDARLEYEKWSEGWWSEMAGGGLHALWEEYMDYYEA